MKSIHRLVVLSDKLEHKYAKDGATWTCQSPSEDKPFHLPSGHKPYMVLPEGGTGPFSCANCVAHYMEGKEHHCKSPDYAAYMGGSLLVDEDGAPLDDPSRACSDFFTPKSG